MKATLFLLLALHLPLAGHAQSYPSRPIRVIIGQAAGGGVAGAILTAIVGAVKGGKTA